MRHTLPAILLCLSALTSHAEFCRVGDTLDVEWKGNWYPARVLKTDELGERCYIQYQGYGSEWNEWVDENRAAILARVDGGAVARYATGDAVMVHWKDKWYPASILEARHGRYRVHYDGYEASWDEWVGLRRIKPR